MKMFSEWLLTESMLPAIQKAIKILVKYGMDEKTANKKAEAISKADPYTDKRFAPLIAYWLSQKIIHEPDEHTHDIKRFKELQRQLDKLAVPAHDTERKSKIDKLLAATPRSFKNHYSNLQDWIQEASPIVDLKVDLSDDGLEVVGRYNGYTMYKISEKTDCKVPLIKNTMSWCVTQDLFGKYGGPPYYPVVRDRDRRPFAMIIPAYFDVNPDEAVRNASNKDRLSATDLRKIKPLVKMVIDPEKHNHPYAKGIHDMKEEPFEIKDNKVFSKSIQEELKKIITYCKDNVIELAEWPEAMKFVLSSPEHAYNYAFLKNAPFPEGEPVIAEDAEMSYNYAYLNKKSFPLGEPTIATSAKYSYLYAEYVVGSFAQGETAIATDPEYSYLYAARVISDVFPLGEAAISTNARYSYLYAIWPLRNRFHKGETAIAKSRTYSALYEKAKLHNFENLDLM